MSCPKTGSRTATPDSSYGRLCTIWSACMTRKARTPPPLLMSKLGPNAEAARELAYRLYRICDQKNRSQEALGYNALVQSWPEVARLAQQVVRPTQGRMGLPDDR